MTRAVRPASIQSAIQSAYRASGGLECVAHDLGVSIATLSYGVEINDARPGGLGANYLDRLGRIEPAAARPIADHFCHLAGGVFQPVEFGGHAGADLARLAKEFSDVLARHAEAHSAQSPDPSGYTPAEAAAQVRELDDLIAVAVSMRAALGALL